MGKAEKLVADTRQSLKERWIFQRPIRRIGVVQPVTASAGRSSGYFASVHERHVQKPLLSKYRSCSEQSLSASQRPTAEVVEAIWRFARRQLRGPRRRASHNRRVEDSERVEARQSNSRCAMTPAYRPTDRPRR